MKPLARQLRGGRSSCLLSERIVGFSQPPVTRISLEPVMTNSSLQLNAIE